MPFIIMLKFLWNFLRTRSPFLAGWALMYELFDHRFVGGELVCPHAEGVVIIRQYVKGRLVGTLKIRTCPKCDPGT